MKPIFVTISRSINLLRDQNFCAFFQLPLRGHVPAVTMIARPIKIYKQKLTNVKLWALQYSQESQLITTNLYQPTYSN